MTRSTFGGDVSRRALLKTGAILALGIGTGIGSMWKPTMLEAATAAGDLSPVLGTPTTGNARAIQIAQSSPLAKATFGYLQTLAGQIKDAGLQKATLDMLTNPAPTYQLLSPTQADKEKVLQELAAAGLAPKETTVEGVFPAAADPKIAPQPFWSAPGSGYAGHHSYPGGLGAHVAYNALIAAQMFDTYEKVYTESIGAAAMPISWDYSIGAPLWHDVAKPLVLQWKEDSSLIKEQTIADTGAHHTIGGAEAITRGMSPRFVLAMLSAHDYPATDTAPRVVNYARAAAIIARVDPVAFGLVQADGKGGYKLNPENMAIDAFIDHLSDHDWVFSGTTATVMIAELKTLAKEKFGIDADTDTAKFNDFRNRVFAALSDIRLYNILVAGGHNAVAEAVSALAL